MNQKLSDYHRMRDFGITPEPKGETRLKGKQLRFVIQKHDARNLHYDFRLELDGTLKSWAVPKGPSLDPADKRLAVHVEDHPLDYAEFEGIIPAHQYGAGTVIVWDTGNWIPDGDPAAGYAAGKLKFHLEGTKLQGGWTLVRTRLPGSSGKEQWLLIKERDDRARPAADFDVTSALPDSVLGKRSTPPTSAKPAGRAKPKTAQQPESGLGVIKGSIKAPLPATMKPQLATLVDAVPDTDGWEYEIKFDGYRLLAQIDGNDVKLLTRAGNDWTAKLPDQAKALNALGLENAWLDGEIAVLDAAGIPSFQLLQNAFDRDRTADIAFFLFDIPYLNGYDLRAAALSDRRQVLQVVLEGHESTTLRHSAPITEPARQLLDSACKLSMEGIIGKRSDAPYRSGRSTSWIKLKCGRRQEFVVVGYTAPQGTRSKFGALLLAVHEDGKLRYAGRVGTGFDADMLASLYHQLRPLETEICPLPRHPADVRRTQVHWVEPSLVAEVAFAEWTHDGLLRQASFQGMRTDKPAAEIRRETALAPLADHADAAPKKNTLCNRVAGVVITHPDRVLDQSSEYTKLDLARYYEAVALYILPHLRRRPVYLLRAPDGVDGEQFFQKHVERMAIPGIRNLDQSLDPDHAPLMAIDDVAALIGAAQMGTIELHTCNATEDRIDRPDCMIFDLDPDTALPWPTLVEAVKLTKVLLDELGLTSFLKTSGGKGFHLVVPLTRHHDWEAVASFSQSVAQHLARTLPSLFSAKLGSKNRVGKVFVDYLRNKRHASTVCAFSVRARPGMGVSTPLEWAELSQVKSAAQWNIVNLPERLASLEADPWRDYDMKRCRLSAAMKRSISSEN
ncbi:MAG: DNA ligase D [Herminiimonas sp.]|nr:DNA ligase D [Herminiimonas sp.]